MKDCYIITIIDDSPNPRKEEIPCYIQDHNLGLNHNGVTRNNEESSICFDPKSVDLYVYKNEIAKNQPILERDGRYLQLNSTERIPLRSNDWIHIDNRHFKIQNILKTTVKKTENSVKNLKNNQVQELCAAATILISIASAATLTSCNTNGHMARNACETENVATYQACCEAIENPSERINCCNMLKTSHPDAQCNEKIAEKTEDTKNTENTKTTDENKPNPDNLTNKPLETKPNEATVTAIAFCHSQNNKDIQAQRRCCENLKVQNPVINCDFIKETIQDTNPEPLVPRRVSGIPRRPDPTKQQENNQK